MEFLRNFSAGNWVKPVVWVVASITKTVISNNRRCWRRVLYSTRTYEQVPYGVAAVFVSAYVGRLTKLFLICGLLRFVCA